MNRKVTIALDNIIELKIRAIQVKKISETKKDVSFSSVINDVLNQGLKKFL